VPCLPDQEGVFVCLVVCLFVCEMAVLKTLHVSRGGRVQLLILAASILATAYGGTLMPATRPVASSACGPATAVLVWLTDVRPRVCSQAARSRPARLRGHRAAALRTPQGAAAPGS
jgi:hypothetical protein